jgi:hypothetical protein
LSSTIIDDGLTSRRRGNRPRRSFRRGLRITSGCPWRNSWITSRTNANPTCSETTGIRRSPQFTIAARQNTVIIARNRRVLTLRMCAGFLTGRTRAPREPYCPRQCRCPGCPGFGQCWDIGLGNRIELSSHRSAGARIASFSLS